MQIILNGWLSKRISSARGVRQGDLFSPLLYVLCVEVLASLIRHCPGVEGSSSLVPESGKHVFACMPTTLPLYSRVFDPLLIFSAVLISMKGAPVPN